MRARILPAVGAALAGALASGAFAAASLQAQTAAAGETPWRAWIGCWEPVTPDNVIATADAKALRVCVVPGSSPSVVEVLNVASGKVTQRTRVDASGARAQIGREGCTGVESARWSDDRLRVYLTAELTCDGVQRTTSGILAFAPTGEWLDVQGVTTGRNSGVHATRYRPALDLTGIPAEVAAMIPSAPLAVSTARGAAAGPVQPQDVADAVRHVSAPVVEAWLLERGQGFKLSARELVALADGGVPGSVTDLMVALSFPKTFAVNRGSREADLLRPRAGSEGNVVAGRTIPVMIDRYGYSPFGWGPYSPYYGYGYGYRYGSRYGGYDPFGYPYGGYGYGGPIIITRVDETSGSGSRPRVVNGRGYTEGRPSPSTSSGSYGNTGSSGNSGNSGNSGSSSSNNSGASSAGASSTSGGERTAKPRP